tara:strand:+ start:260 stop:679 length:420 start_codon:yes stop_codon:yes gene_type:complete
MSHLHSHQLTERRTVLFGLLFAFVFIFATPAFAKTTTRSMQMEMAGASHSEYQAVSNDMADTADYPNDTNHNNCCDDDDQKPCPDDDIECTTACSIPSLSPAILMGIGDPRRARAATEFACEPFAISGMFVHLTPPPPR